MIMLTTLILFITTGMFHPDSVPSWFHRQLSVYPQEKVYAQIDKPVYIAGEDIWLRGYVLDAALNTVDTTSRYMYVELITPQNEVEQRVRIRQEDGAYSGHLPLSERLQEGDYRLRFYTRYLENQGTACFFERDVRIGTLAGLDEHKRTNRSKKRAAHSRDYGVSFFPEGGHAIPGVMNRLGFKALNESGLGEDVAGVILNSKGDSVTHFSSSYRGVGSLFYVPVEGEQYYAVCENREGIERRIPLPLPRTDALSLRVDHFRDKIYIQVTRAPQKMLPDSLSLIVSGGGFVVYNKWWSTRAEAVVIPKEDLPDGVVQVLLADNAGNPLSERLIFNRRESAVPILSFETTKEEYDARELIEATLLIRDQAGNPLEGDFSISVTDDRDVEPDSCVNILSALLLTSELKGHIETPAYYFRDNESSTLQQLDNLMLTQGWSRYDVKKLLKGEVDYPSHGKEWSMQIEGQVKGGIFRNRKGEGFPVRLLATDPFLHLDTETDENGFFCFAGFELPDSVNYTIQGRNPKGRLNVEIIPEEETFPGLRPFIPVPDERARSSFNQYLQKADMQLLLSKGIRTIHLSDVVVTAPVKEKGKSVYSSSFSNEIYRREDHLSQFQSLNIFTYLQSLPGVTVMDSIVCFVRNRGAPPLILLDDVPIDHDFLSTINLNDVEEIELLKGIEATILGSRAWAGAVLITTRSGEFKSELQELYHIKTVTPLGYQVKKEFYTPLYETEEQKNAINPDMRTTIHWEPQVLTGPEGKASVSFYSGEPFDSYSVIIEGITPDGKIIYNRRQIKGMRDK